jgi:hypothetical protein
VERISPLRGGDGGCAAIRRPCTLLNVATYDDRPGKAVGDAQLMSVSAVKGELYSAKCVMDGVC